MRLPLLFASLFALSACASISTTSDPIPSKMATIEGATPGMVAAGQGDHLYGAQQAQLRVIAEAEARVDLARARLDLDTVRRQAADDGDVREFLDARRALRDARNVYGPTETGRQSWSVPFWAYGRNWPRRDRNWSTEPVGTFGLSKTRTPVRGEAKPLSGQSGN